MAKVTKSKVPVKAKAEPVRTIGGQGNIYYTLPNGQHHREDGPAVEYTHGQKEWWINGRHHRVDGPAIITDNGDQYWMQDGNYHREDGPALAYASGRKTYYIKGVCHTEGKFFEILKDNRMRKALGSLEKFADKHGNNKSAEKAGAALMKFLQGECDHTFQNKDNECELCDSQ